MKSLIFVSREFRSGIDSTLAEDYRLRQTFPTVGNANGVLVLPLRSCTVGKSTLPVPLLLPGLPESVDVVNIPCNSDMADLPVGLTEKCRLLHFLDLFCGI